VKHGKPFSVPEWGVTGADTQWGSPTALGSGDDPAYVRGMFQFFEANAANVAFEDYFNDPVGDRNSLYGTVQMPNSSAAYKSLWSALPSGRSKPL
jgi:hypothetical protein